MVGLIQHGISKNNTHVWGKLASEFVDIGVSYTHLQEVSSDAFKWASDAFVMAGMLDQALIYYPEKPGELDLMTFDWDSHYSMGLNKYFSIKRAAGQDINGLEAVVIAGKRGLTEYGKEYIEAISVFAEEALREREEERGQRIIDIPLVRRVVGPGIPLFRGCPFTFQHSQIWHLGYAGNVNVMDWLRATIKRAENKLRSQEGLDLIGTGFSFGETALYEIVKRYVEPEKVLRQVMFSWLGFQHIDIYIPSLKLGLEFQGKQHYEPVDFFGGEEAFVKAQERDQRKAGLCAENGVKLIYFRFDEHMSRERVEDKIEMAVKRSSTYASYPRLVAGKAVAGNQRR